jgi:hypothetical protein
MKRFGGDALVGRRTPIGDVVRATLAGALALVLAGCGSLADPAEAGPESAGRAQRVAIPPAPPPIDDDPERLLGLDAAALRALLGTPGFVRRDSPAELWRYTNKSCLLDLFLYRTEASGVYVVRHLTARPAQEDARQRSITARACLGGLLREKADALTG